MSESTSHDAPPVSPPGSGPVSPAKIELAVSDIIPAKFNFNKDLEVDKPSSVADRGYDVNRYPSSITEEKLDVVRADCGWDARSVRVFVPGPDESVTDYREGFLYVYTYPFTLKIDPPIDPVILDMCRTYGVTLAQIGPIVWRVVACLRLLANHAGKEFSLSHLIRLYSPRIFRGGVIKLVKRSRNPFFSKMDEDRDRGWLERYVRVKTEDIVPADYLPFPEKWNPKRKPEPLGNRFYALSHFLSIL